MSLQIWLPLNGNLNNYGLDSFDITNNTGATINASGKLGSCYSFDATNDWIQGTFDKTKYSGKPMSLACWFKCDKTDAGGAIIDLAADLCLGYSYTTDGIRFSGWRCWSNNGTRTGSNSLISTYFNADVWHHAAITFVGGIEKIYVDGALVQTFDHTNLYTNNWVPLLPNSSYNKFSVGKSAGDANWIGGLINDVRVYDHELSAKEVKEISKALVLHYKLDDAYIEGTSNGIPFQSDFASWSSYGFGSTGTKTILTGLTPNGTNIYCRVGSTRTTAGTTEMARWTTAVGALSPNGKATFSAYVRGIDDMIGKNGFLHVYNTINGKTQSTNVKNFTFTAEWQRVDGQFTWVQDQASATSYSVYVCGTNMVAGNEFEFCEAQFELKDHATAWVNGTRDNSATIYDTSGFGNDGTASTNLTVLNSSPRYSNATYLTSAAIIFHSRCLSNTNQEWTCAAWVKPDAAGNHQSLNNFNRNNKLYHGTYPLLYLNDGTNDYYNYGNLALPAGQWSHIAFVFNNTTGTKLIYINGVEHTNKTGPNKTSTPAGIPDTVVIGSQYAGYISDYREYATALSAADVLELYQTSGSIDNQGNVYAREVIE